MTRTPKTFVALATLGVLLVACSTGAGGPASPDSSVAPAPTSSGPAGEAFDQLFIDMMVPHHESAVEMASIAIERAERPEIRQLAEEIVSAQDAEIAQLREWRQAWFGSSDTPSMDEMPMLPGMGMQGMDMGETMDMTADIEELRTADPFDPAFLEAMIAHHESAIQAAELAREQATRPEIRELAEAIITAQQGEIDRMRAWLAEG